MSFYTLFFRKPVGKYMLQVCRNLSCQLNGAEEIMAYARIRMAEASRGQSAAASTAQAVAGAMLA